MRTTTLLGAALLAALGAAGCGDTECGEAPPGAIHRFIVTTKTGFNATDMEINFCYLRKSAESYMCFDLDNSGVDDFERYDVNSFACRPSTPIAPGDLDRIKMLNAGGGFLENNWDMRGLRVEAEEEGGERTLLFERWGYPTSVTLSRGEAYLPDCRY